MRCATADGASVAKAETMPPFEARLVCAFCERYADSRSTCLPSLGVVADLAGRAVVDVLLDDAACLWTSFDSFICLSRCISSTLAVPTSDVALAAS